MLSSILHVWPNSLSFLWMALCSRSVLSNKPTAAVVLSSCFNDCFTGKPRLADHVLFLHLFWKRNFGINGRKFFKDWMSKHWRKYKSLTLTRTTSSLASSFHRTSGSRPPFTSALRRSWTELNWAEIRWDEWCDMNRPVHAAHQTQSDRRRRVASDPANLATSRRRRSGWTVTWDEPAVCTSHRSTLMSSFSSNYGNVA